MLAVYATHAAPDDPLSALEVGQQPEPNVPEGWVRVKVSHASLNRHDVFTLRGISGHPEGITYPIILGNDAAGTLDDGTPPSTAITLFSSLRIRSVGSGVSWRMRLCERRCI